MSVATISRTVATMTTMTMICRVCIAGLVVLVTVATAIVNVATSSWTTGSREFTDVLLESAIQPFKLGIL